MTSGTEWHLSKDHHDNQHRHAKSHHDNIRTNHSDHQSSRIEDIRPLPKDHSLDHQPISMALNILLRPQRSMGRLSLARPSHLEMAMANSRMAGNLTRMECPAQHHIRRCPLMLVNQSNNRNFGRWSTTVPHPQMALARRTNIIPTPHLASQVERHLRLRLRRLLMLLRVNVRSVHQVRHHHPNASETGTMTIRA